MQQQELTIQRREQIVSISSPQYTTTPFQRWYYQRNVQQLYSVFIVGSKLNLSSAQPIPTSIFNQWVNKSLSDLIYSFLTLALNVYEDGQMVGFLEKVSAEDVMTYHTLPASYTDEELIQVIHTIQETPLLCYGSATLPMWRLHIVNQEWFFVAFDHLLYDGLSGANFQKHLFASLNTNIGMLTRPTLSPPKLPLQVSEAGSAGITPWDFVEVKNQLFSRQALITLISLKHQQYQEQQSSSASQPDTPPLTRLVPFPMEFHINTVPTWMFLGRVVGGEIAPAFLKRWCTQASRRLGLLPTPNEFEHQPETDEWYVLKVKVDNSEENKNESDEPSPQSSPQQDQPKYTTPLTCIPGKFDSHLRIIRITAAQLNKLKTTILKPYNIRLSPFLTYLFSLALLPLTLGASTGIGIPTDARAHAAKAVTNSSLYRPVDTTMTDLLEVNQQFDFGCYIGLFATRLKSLLNYISALSHWTTTPPDSVEEGLDEIRRVMGTTQGTTNSLIYLPFLQTLSNSFSSTLNQPDTSPNGLFMPMGLLQIADKLIGLDKVVKRNTEVPERDATLEVSNLGLVKFNPSSSQPHDDSQLKLTVNDILFTQPATRGCYFGINVVGLDSPLGGTDDHAEQQGASNPNPGGINIVLSASSFVMHNDFTAIANWIDFALNNLDGLLKV